MKVSRNVVIIITLGVILCGVAATAYYKSNHTTVPDRKILEGKADFLASYDKALVYEAKIKENPQEVVNYVVAGSEWKMIADSLREKVWYQLSLSAYERGIAVTQEKNSLLLVNAGQIAEELGDYTRAKNYYLVSIDLSPGDVSYHLLYIKLLKNKFHASEHEILSAYDVAMARVVGGADLVSSRAQYLKSIGRYADARDDLELLLKNKIITQAQFDDEVAEMKQLEASHK